MDASQVERAEQMAEQIAGQARTHEDLNDLMRLVMKSALQRMLDTEMDMHLGRRGSPENSTGQALEPAAAEGSAEETEPAKSVGNRRNGHSQKTVKGEMGELRVEIPRDRNGTFEPQLIGKYQRRIAGFDEKILALYAKGMTTRDIQTWCTRLA